MNRARAKVVLATVVAMTASVAASHGVGAAAATSTSPTAQVAAASAAGPSVPATGRFHPLAVPQRIASTLTGTGLPAAKLAPNSATTVAVAGHGGVPASNVRAVTAVVTAVQPDGATRLLADTGAAAPASVPLVVTGGSRVSAFGVLPLSTAGAIRVRNGAKATHLTIDVTGWFSSASETGTAGLFNRLSGREIAAATVPANGQQTIAVAGNGSVPASGGSSVLVRLVADQATATGLMSLGAANSSGKTTEAYGVGSTTDLAVSKLAANGSLIVANAGAQPVHVTLSALGWFTDGSDPQAFGDTLRLMAKPVALLTNAAVPAAGTKVIVAGVNGVPSETSGTPPSLVLSRTTALATSNGVLRAHAVSAGVDDYAVLPYVANRAAAGQALLRPGTLNNTRYVPAPGPVTVSAEEYAWFAGALVLNPGLHVLTGTTLSGIKTVTPTSIRFTGVPADLSSLKANDVLAAGISTKTPKGLLRVVSSKTTANGDLVVTTTDGVLADAVNQGAFAAGTSSAEAPPPTATRARPVPKPRAPSDAAAAATCSVGGSLVGFGVSVSCSDSIGDGSTWSGDISASAGLAFAVDASIHPGLPPSVDVSASMQVSAAASGSASATAAADLNVVVPMGERRLAPIDIQLGPVPVVIEPIFNAQLHVTGHLEATFQALGNVSGGFGVAYNSGSGFTTTHGFGGSGNGTYNASASATARAAFEPSITAAFYGDEDIGVFATLSPYVQMDADQCIVKGKSGVDLTLGLKLSVFGHNVLDASTTIPVIENELYNVAWRNCALWSGTINFSAQVHFDSGGAANSRQTRDEHSSSSGHIEWSNSSPPVYDIYPFQTSGSGAEVYKQNTNCGTGNPPPVVTNTTTTNWAGDVNSYGSPLTLSITPADGTHTKWVASTQGPGNTKMPATQTYKYWGYDANGYCKQYTDHPQIGEWPQDIFGVIDQGQVTDSFIFTLPAGQATSSGTRKVTPVANSNQPTVTVSWSLTKTCTQGGTSC